MDNPRFPPQQAAQVRLCCCPYNNRGWWHVVGCDPDAHRRTGRTLDIIAGFHAGRPSANTHASKGRVRTAAIPDRPLVLRTETIPPVPDLLVSAAPRVFQDCRIGPAGVSTSSGSPFRAALSQGSPKRVAPRHARHKPDMPLWEGGGYC